ncbi:MAG: XdhC family protein [Nitrososphaerota archaeon]|nr:XdhC family protein [Nitrososphaerota archaeon]
MEDARQGTPGMSHDILLRALQLGESDEAFAIVGVTKTEGPTAVKAGNKSIIRQNGSIEGWVGGHCTEEEILRNALKAIEDGTTRTLKLSTCHGGTMDVYVEPYLPRRKLVVLGRVPIVSALSRLAEVLNFNVVVIDKNASKEKYPQADLVLKTLDELDSVRLTRQTYVVIATMGERDQEYAARLVDCQVPYVGIVAGKKRASEILDFLSAAGVRENQVSKVKSPAGIYIGALTAEEIALSIMAEIIELSRGQGGDLREYARKGQNRSSHPRNRIASSPQNMSRHGGEQVVVVDPVCGMTVDASHPVHYSTVEGRKIAFCSAACKEEFDKDPSKYLLKQRS